MCLLCQSLVNLRPRRPSQVEVRETDLSGSVDTVLHSTDIRQRSKSAVSVERALDTNMVLVGLLNLMWDRSVALHLLGSRCFFLHLSVPYLVVGARLQNFTAVPKLQGHRSISSIFYFPPPPPDIVLL